MQNNSIKIKFSSNKSKWRKINWMNNNDITFYFYLFSHYLHFIFIFNLLVVLFVFIYCIIFIVGISSSNKFECDLKYTTIWPCISILALTDSIWFTCTFSSTIIITEHYITLISTSSWLLTLAVWYDKVGC